VIAHVGAHERPKVVALVGYHDDAEAGAIAVRLPYGRGDGIEEIVFGRVRPATDEAWPGEDRTYLVDEVGSSWADRPQR
jgi:hypothetical protein